MITGIKPAPLWFHMAGWLAPFFTNGKHMASAQLVHFPFFFFCQFGATLGNESTLVLEPRDWRAVVVRNLSPPGPTCLRLLFSFPMEPGGSLGEGTSVPASRNALEVVEEDGGWMGGWWVAAAAAAFPPLCENESINSSPPPPPPLPPPSSPPCACCLCLLARWFLLSCQRQHYHILVAWETSAVRDNDLKPWRCLKLVNMKGYPLSRNPNINERVSLLEDFLILFCPAHCYAEIFSVQGN